MKQQSTSKGFAYLSVAEMLVKIMSVVYVPLLVRILGDVGHGIYVVSYDAFTFIYVLTNEGIQRGIAKLISELTAKGNYRDALRAFRLARSVLIVLSLLASILLFAMAPLIATASKSPQAVTAIRALSPTVLITGILSAYRGYFLGRSYIASNAISKIIEQLVNVIVSLGAAWALMKISIDYGVAGGTLGTSIGALVAVILLIREYYKGRLHKVKRSMQAPEAYRHTNKELLMKLFNYGFPITMSAGIQNLGGFIDMFIVNNALYTAGLDFTAAKTAFSQLSRYKTLIYTPNTIIVALTAVLLPGISRARALEDDEDVERKIRFAVKTVFMIAMPSAFGLMVLADPVYALLYPGRAGAVLLKYGAFVVVFLGFVMVQNVIFQSFGRFYWGIMTLSAGIAVKLISNSYFVVIPEVNIMGAVLSMYLNYIIPFMINNILITRGLGIRMNLLRESLRPLAASAAMGGVLYLTNMLFTRFGAGYAITSILTLANIVIGMAVYFTALLLIGGLKKDEISEISPRLLRMIPEGIRNRMK